MTTRRLILGPLSPEAQAARAPLRPEELVGALKSRPPSRCWWLIRTARDGAKADPYAHLSPHPFKSEVADELDAGGQ